ncbi:MAG: hypothetical protein SW833_17410, partial [Cyanobacteriota bacterium]|nr:hypothetical protein [Cyanobacteriota bacterium]
MNYRHLKFWASQTFVLSALPLTFAIGIGAEVQAASFVFQAGNMDNFDTSDGIEAATPSAGLDQYIRNFFGSRCNSSPPLCEIRNFDERTVDKIFRHTINLNSVVGNITSAQLEIRVRGDGSGLNYNDTISLGFVDENAERNSVSWGRAIGSSNGSNGLLPTLWGQNEVHTFNFDLANLPLPNANTPNFISTLNALRF